MSVNLAKHHFTVSEYERMGETGIFAPEDVLLAIEVAETTVQFDRRVKMPLYARAGIAEALLFNLPEDQVEYFARPEMGAYHENSILSRGEKFESTIVPGLALDIATILG